MSVLNIISTRRVTLRFILRVSLAALVALPALTLGGCSSQRVMTSDQMRQEYDPSQDGYNYLDDADDYYYDYMGY